MFLLLFSCLTSSLEPIKTYEFALQQLLMEVNEEHVQYCATIKDDFYQKDCLYFAAEQYAKQEKREMSEKTCEIFNNKQHRSECLFRIAEILLDTKYCEHQYQLDCQLHVFSKQLMMKEPKEDDIISYIPKDLDQKQFWISAYRYLLPKDLQFDCADTKQETYCIIALQGIYIDQWRRNIPLCKKILQHHIPDTQNNLFPPTPNLSQEQRKSVQQEYIKEIQFIGRCP